jgi:hypothetical protein
MTNANNTFWYFPLSSISYNSKTFAGPVFNPSVSGSFSYGTTNSTRANLYFPSTGIYQINFVFQISEAIGSLGCINFKYNPTTPYIPHASEDTKSLVALYYSPPGSYGGCVMASVYIRDTTTDYITLSVFATGYQGNCATGSRNSLQIIKVEEIRAFSLYDYNQALTTTSNVTFNQITTTTFYMPHIEISSFGGGSTQMIFEQGIAPDGSYGVIRHHCSNGTYFNINTSVNSYYIVNYTAGAGVYLDYGNNSWSGYSDILLKTNIEPMKPCLDLINQLKPVSYNWKKLPNEPVNYGFIAQDVEQVIPGLVSIGINQETKEDVKCIKSTDGLVPYLVKAIQEQQVMINKMNNEIIELKMIVENLIKLNNLIPQ